ncbi:MAG TPA: Ig-like domain-containing protein [Longimicrobium sp.]|nr:Ig-like domain-containing protein [Longimicrobium sp.]
MRIQKTLLAAAALLITPLWAACDETPVVLPEPTSVSVAAADLRMTVGDVAPMGAQVLDQQGRVVQGATPTYTSDNPTVATVDPAGMVRALSPGAANIVVAYGSMQATAKVTVGREERGFVKTLDVLADSLAFDVRAGTQAVSLRAFNGFGQPVCPAVTVRSSDASVAQGASAGSCRITITPLIQGTATLVVQADGVRDSVRVRVGSNGSFVYIAGRPAPADVYAGNTVSYTVRMLDTQGNPVPNRLVHLDVTAGALSATAVTTDATGSATVQWTLPTNLRTLGNVHTLYVRAELPSGVVGGWNESVFVNGAPAVSLQLYRYLWPSELVPITTASVPAQVGNWVDLAAGALDAYGNSRAETITFTVTPNAYVSCLGWTVGDATRICLYRWDAGTTTVTAATPGGLSKSVDVVFSY